MPDLLVKLYALPAWPAAGALPADVVVRRALAHEKVPVVNWVGTHFGSGWAGECDVAFHRSPVSCHIALHQGELLGFACWDSTCRGFFGPLGVAEAWRGRGGGRALLLSCLHAMASAGYGYAVIGGAGSPDFYAKTVGAVEIPGSSPGIYRDPLKKR